MTWTRWRQLIAVQNSRTKQERDYVGRCMVCIVVGLDFKRLHHMIHTHSKLRAVPLWHDTIWSQNYWKVSVLIGRISDVSIIAAHRSP